MKLWPATLAALAVRPYDPTAKWTMLLTGPVYGNSTVGVLVDPVAGRVDICPQGTVPGVDFIKDLAAALPVWCGSIGWVPYGFALGMWAVYKKTRPLVLPGYVLTIGGHSLGASQAAILAALFIAGGLVPSAVTLLACPRVGSAVAALLARCQNVLSFINGADPVPDVPLTFAACAPPIRIHVPPTLPEIGLEWHSSALYLKGITALGLPAFDAEPALEIPMTDLSSGTTATITTAVPAVTTPEHLSFLQSFSAGFESLIAKLKADFGIVAAVQTQALPTEVALAQVGAIAAGQPGLAPVIGAAGTAAAALNAGATVNPTSIADVLTHAAAVSGAVQAAVTAASGKAAPAQLTATTEALAAAATLPPSPVPAT